MYLDFSGSGDVSQMVHVGRTGSFVPVTEGGQLWRVQDEKLYAVAGTKGYSWVDRDFAYAKYKIGELELDMGYFNNLKMEALEAILAFCKEDDLCVFKFLEDEY